jgi:Zn-dependent metalloprotease
MFRMMTRSVLTHFATHLWQQSAEGRRPHVMGQRCTPDHARPEVGPAHETLAETVSARPARLIGRISAAACFAVITTFSIACAVDPNDRAPGAFAEKPLSALESTLLDRVMALDTLYSATAGDEAMTAPGTPDAEPPQAAFQFSRAGVVRSLRGPGMALPVAGVTAGTTRPEEAAQRFLADWAILFGIRDPAVELQFLRTRDLPAGEILVRFGQRTRTGRPVFAHQLVVVLDRSLRVNSVTGLFLPAPPDAESVISSADATRIAAVATARTDAEPQAPVLGVFDAEAFDAPPTPPRLAWQIDLATGEPALWRHYVDAQTGALLHRYDALARDRSRETYWGNHLPNMPGTRIFADNPRFEEDDPYWPDNTPGMDAACAAVESFLDERLERDSWDDGAAGPMKHRISCTSDNGPPGGSGAWWSDTPYYWARFEDQAHCTDFAAHEIFHGVDDVEGHLGGTGQPGALGESFGDFFGQMTERYASGMGTDWRQGTGAPCVPIRDLADPELHPGCPLTCDYQPAHYLNYSKGGLDEPHRNDGIPNKAGWLLGREPADGSNTFAGITVTGIGDTNASLVWYDAFLRMHPGSVFRDFRNAVIDSAAALFGVGDNRYVQALRSVDAIGAWSSDYWLSFDSDARMGFARFTAASQDRRYAFYKEPLSSNARLMYRYKTVCMYCGGTWSSATPLDYTASGPAAVVFDSKLWVFYRYDLTPYRIFYYTFDSSGSPSTRQWPTGTPQSDADLAAVVFNGKIYLFYREPGTGATAIHYYTRAPGTVDWTGPYETGALSDSGPAAAAPLDGKVWLFYVRGSFAPNLRYRTMTSSDSDHWSSETNLGRAGGPVSLGSPAANIFRDRVNVSTRTTLPTNYLVFASYCPSTTSCTYGRGGWSELVTMDIAGRGGVTLWEEGLGHLYLLYRSLSSTAVWWDYKRSE